MSKFTIETTFRVPCYRQETVEAATLDAAVAIAKADEGDGPDWKWDYDSSGPIFVSGAWAGENAYPDDASLAIDVDSEFGEPIDKAPGSPWDRGYQAGFADGVDDAVPGLVDASREALRWLAAERDSHKPGDGSQADEIVRLLRAALGEESGHV